MSDVDAVLSRALAVLAVAIAAPRAAAQRVWVVAPKLGAGVNFTKIQAAVDAAASGDIVLVRQGSYRTFRIRGKSLAVVGDGSRHVTLNAASQGLVIDAIGPGQSVVVRNFALIATTVTPLTVSNCAGPVTIEDGSFRAALAFQVPAAASITGSRRVSLVRCTLAGGSGFRGPSGGLWASSSNVMLHGCTLRGGSGSTSARFAGASGATLFRTTLSASGTTFTGGAGSRGTVVGSFCFFPPRNGGDALHFGDAASSARLLAVTLAPGRAGSAPPGCPPARNGHPIAGPGTATILGTRTGTLTSNSPVRLGQVLVLTLAAPPRLPVWLAASATQKPVFVAGCNGAILPDIASSVFVFAGTTSASGRVQLRLTVPNLQLQGATVFFQMAIAGPTSGCFAGTPTAVLVLDRKF